MPNDLPTSMLYEHPLPLASLALGQLVRDPKRPSLSYYNPSLYPGGERIQAIIAPPHGDPEYDDPVRRYMPEYQERQWLQDPPERREQRVNILQSAAGEVQLVDWDKRFESARHGGSSSTRLEASLRRLLSFRGGGGASSTTAAADDDPARYCGLSRLKDPDGFFEAACAADLGVRAWLEAQLSPSPWLGGDGMEEGHHHHHHHNNDGDLAVYLVCGFELIFDGGPINVYAVAYRRVRCDQWRRACSRPCRPARSTRSSSSPNQSTRTSYFLVVHHHDTARRRAWI
ncbi:hypothetical protein GGTG_09388 [Gaeumannomyces tritici R3-111a-1]|uniref:Uncharacterized protein n=1 Tax=Gaeumannomyces tritici (strain R3-111a-1) TaxID=644352 RepID=J3P792_GAET3|nr:hypothetical protein GGTG_09388 [Gaeumannomyces tritici R3-111a-1]EJT72523.1 hypothetical protein GGTG_09388 [Gaeumannomyces tritici R3-111a-1]